MFSRSVAKGAAGSSSVGSFGDVVSCRDFAGKFCGDVFGQMMWKSQLRKFHAARMSSCFSGGLSKGNAWSLSIRVCRRGVGASIRQSF